MRATLPFASGGLRELAAIWRADLSKPMSPDERDELRVRLAEVCAQILQTDPDPIARREIAELLFALHGESPVRASLLEAVAEAADEQGDLAIRRRALEQLASCDDAPMRARALEHLGDVFDQLGDRRSAIDSWRPAAQMRARVPSDHPRAQRLYERVLDSSPDDRDAAERLIDLYAAASAWDRIPEVFGVVVRGDADRAAEVLLRLEAGALEAGAIDALATMVDEVLALRSPHAATSRHLRHTKARALATVASRQAEAVATYRALLEDAPPQGRDAIRRELESLVATLRDPSEQHAERRWIYEWRARNDANPTAALVALAEAESAHGARDRAVAAYRRAAEVAAESERPTLLLRAACLLEEAGRAAEAVTLLVPALILEPTIEVAHVIARSMLGDPSTGTAVANQLEHLANEADDAKRVRLLAFLADAREETASMPEARQRWVRGLGACSTEAHAPSLATLLRGAAEVPREIALWDAAERIGRARGEIAPVLRAYADTIVRHEGARDLVESLGRRMVALSEECSVDGSLFLDALERVLEELPDARWALDRFKVALGREGRWEAFFRAYDRAIATARDDDERAELQGEAAFAARDLAFDPARAIHYLRATHALRPYDDDVATALERLYAREGATCELVDLLAERANRSTGGARAELSRRVATLQLEIGRVDEAHAGLEAMLDEGAATADLVDLFEAVAREPDQARAGDRLLAHYEGLGRFDDAVRVAERALALARDARERTARVRELVRVRLAAERGAPGAFARVAEQIEAAVGVEARAAKAAWRALLGRAIVARNGAAIDAEIDDAADGAWRALTALAALFADEGDAVAASRTLERGARLRFARPRRRDLLHRAVALCPEGPDHAPRALRMLDAIFREDGGDAAATSLFDRFARLLDAAGDHEALASLWEDRARRSTARLDIADARASWERAAALWEPRGAWDRVVAAHRAGAAVGSRLSLEALARIHAARGEWPDAVAALETLCARASDDAREGWVVRLADAYVAQGRTDRAREILEELVAWSPVVDGDVRDRLVALYRGDGLWRALADLLAAEAPRIEEPARRAALFEDAASILVTKLDARGEAAALLEQAIRFDTGDRPLRLQLGDLLEERGEWERVIAIYREHVALRGERRSKERALVHHRIARALARTGQAAEALEELAIAARMLPTDAIIVRDLGEAALDAGDLDLAERTFRSLVLLLRDRAESPGAFGIVDVYVRLARIASKKGDARRAAVLLESALERAPTLGARTLALGELAALCTGDLAHDESLAARVRGHADALVAALRDLEPCEAATLLDAGAWTALCGETLARTALGWRLGRALEQAGRSHDAKAVYESLVALRPIDPDVARGLAERLESLGSERVADALEICVEAEPESVGALAPRLVALREARRDDVGLLRALEIGLAAQPANDTFLCLRAHVRVRLGDLDGAVSDLRRLEDPSDGARDVLASVLERDPRHVGALDRVASLAMQEGSWDRAVDAYAQLVDAAEASEPELLARFASALADACERAGRLEDARDALDRALRADPDCAEVAQRLERIYEAAGEWERLAALLVAQAERCEAPPASSALLLRAARVLLDAGDDAPSPRALDLLARARAADATSIDAALATAAAWSTLGRARDVPPLLAEVALHHRAKKSARLASVYLELGRAHLALDELAEAHDALKAGFAIDMRRAELAMLLGLVAIDLDDAKTAERALLTVATLPSKGEEGGAVDRASAYYHLASIAQARGDVAKARAWAAKAASLDTRNEAAIALDGRMDARSMGLRRTFAGGG